MTLAFDAIQANLGFVLSQTSHIETQVYEVKYADIQYPSLIPVDTSANEWAVSVTYFSLDKVGAAQFVNGRGDDVPFATTGMDKFETAVYMAGIGYRYGIEEVNQAARLGISLDNQGAMAARRAAEELIERVALFGHAEKNMLGLFSYTGVPSAAVPNGASASPLWSSKTAAEILADINSVLTGLQASTNYTRLADTLIMPFERWNSLASIQLPNTTMTILEFVKQNNAYTAYTGQPLTIRGVRGLLTAGSGSTARMVAYRRSPEVLKLHMPMPHRFLPVQVQGLSYQIPGIFRLGGLDVRLPNEIRYADGI